MEADNQSQYDLTGKITIAKFLPDFSGSYSAVYHGNLGHNLVGDLPGRCYKLKIHTTGGGQGTKSRWRHPNYTAGKNRA